MKIIVSITSGSNNTERNILRAFYDGLEKYLFDRCEVFDHRPLKKYHGYDLRLNYDPEIEKCEVGIQFGTVKDRSNEHHITRQSVRKHSRVVVYIETPLLGRKIVKQSNHDYYRIGVNGFLNNDGIFYDEGNIDQERINKIRNDVEVPEFPGWKDHTKGYILILCQLPGDASLRGQKHSEWLVDTVISLRRITQRPIVIRLHPSMSDKGRAEFFGDLHPLILENVPDIIWKYGMDPLSEDLARAGVCVSYTSGSSIDSVLQGVPVIAMDEGNLAYPISSHRLTHINKPKLASKDAIDSWLNKLANSQWTEEEMLDGTAASRIFPIIEQALKDKQEKIEQEREE